MTGSVNAPATDGPLLKYRGRDFVLNPASARKGEQARERVLRGEGHEGAAGLVIFLVMAIGAFALARALVGIPDAEPEDAVAAFIRYTLTPMLAAFGFTTISFREVFGSYCDRWVWYPKDSSLMLRVAPEQRDLVPSVAACTFASPEHYALWGASRLQAARTRLRTVSIDDTAEDREAALQIGRLDEQIEATTAALRTTFPRSAAAQAIADARTLMGDERS